MKITNLQDHFRLELHNYIKKNIRKYYKGLKNGSLKYDYFVNTIFTKIPRPNWLQENPYLEKDSEFRASLVQYVEKTVLRYLQLENENRYNYINKHLVISKDTDKKIADNMAKIIRERKELKKILISKGYTLSIPTKFLTATEAKYLKDYLIYDIPIPLGWEKVLNYIKKST